MSCDYCDGEVTMVWFELNGKFVNKYLLCEVHTAKFRKDFETGFVSGPWFPLAEAME